MTEIYHWQDHAPPSPHNGGWVGIMVCERLLAEGRLDDERTDHVIGSREALIDKHGPVPAEFARHWLLDSADHFAWMQRQKRHHDDVRQRAADKLEATRVVWRKMGLSAERLAA